MNASISLNLRVCSMRHHRILQRPSSCRREVSAASRLAWSAFMVSRPALTKRAGRDYGASFAFRRNPILWAAA